MSVMPHIFFHHAIALFLTLAAMPGVAPAQDFMGITLIELNNGNSVRDVLLGRERGNGSYLVTYISNRGSYASLIAGNFQRQCIAWLNSEESTSGTLSFGQSPTEQSIGRFPHVCMPFTLTDEGGGHIKISANNPFAAQSGPLSSQSRPRAYQGSHSILARIPNTDVNWQSPLFDRYSVNDIELGPMTPSRSARLEVSESGRPESEPVLRTLVTLKDGTNSAEEPRQAMGLFAQSGYTGWPNDVLYSVNSGANPGPILMTVFHDSVVERYGEPSVINNPRGASRVEYYWLAGPDGNLVPPDSIGNDACSRTYPLWESLNFPWYKSHRQFDIGPWGCDLVMWLSHNGTREDSTMNQYSIRAMSGAVFAWLHFRSRLEEVDTIRQEIVEIQSYRPTL